MVTARVSGIFSELQKGRFADFINKFGEKNISLVKSTNTKNVMGRLASLTDGTATLITGSLQFVTFEDKQILDLGFAKIGDGIFYASADTDLDAEDQITVNSVVWELEKQIEAERTQDSLIYQAWIVKRRQE